MYSYKFEEERNQVIADWARYTAERLQRSLLKKKVGISGSLNYSMLYKLASLGGGGGVSSVSHSFNFYGKFIDMGVGRGQKIGDVKGNADMRGMGMGGRRPKKWFSKTYYAEVAELRDLLMQKYGEQALGTIKEEITGLHLLAA